MAESDLQRSVYDLLEKHGIRYARNNSGAKGYVKFGLRVPGLDGGGPDLIVMPGGMRVFRARSLFDAYAAVQEARESGLAVFGLELKSAHKDSCKCKSCESQRIWAAAMRPR